MHGDHPAGAIIESILPFSRYIQRLVESEPELLAELKEGLQRPFLREEMQAFLDADCNIANDEEALHSVLRSLRKRVMLRLATRDLGGLASLVEVMATMTDLAELAISFALGHLQTWLTDPARYGQPRSAENTVQEMLVVAMGKLGGAELNVSSDVDLIFVYPEDGETTGYRSVSNHDFFARLGRKLIASLNDITTDGYVFRVDMRLRPYGESGPLAMSFAMLEEYFITQGREWERYAWIKSRVIAGPYAERLVLMEQVTQPFVFRKYLDFGAYESMRGLHAQIRQEVNRREMSGNIKLGPGGIREIEFIAQLFQLIRGGRDADLRIRSTLDVLGRLREKQQLSEKAVTELSEAYCFLRKLEHRIQYLDDQQTQMLPEIPADQSLIAASMGFSCYYEFLKQLDSHRGNAARHFERVFAAPGESQAPNGLAWLWQDRDSGDGGDGEDAGDDGGTESAAAAAQLISMGFSSPRTILGRLQEFRKGARYRQLPESSKKRVDALIPALIEVSAKFTPADVTLERLLQLLENVSRRAAYLALLREYPKALERVAKLVSASEWASEYLSQHPILLDELLNPGDFQSAPDWSRCRARLIQQLNDAAGIRGNDTEQQMDVLRHFHHAQVFQLLARDVEGLLPLETLSDHLTELADLVLDNVLHLAWSGLRRKHRDKPAFGIIGYGKLGGKELGYASDLDIIFLYDDTHPDAPEIYARLSQRINSWLTSYTSAGLLYETDLRLRPNGSSGLLVSSIQAFEQYQRNQAWVWEHQALTRARFVVGDARVGEAFERIRKEVLCQRRELAVLKGEVLAMRQKILDAHPNSSGLFDVKHDRGGIIDVEFIVQYLVLGYAFKYPELTSNLGNIALLKLAGKLGLIQMRTAERALSAYREFRRVQHRLRLSGDSGLTGIPPPDSKSQKFARVETDYVREGFTAVLRLWDEVFGTTHF
ncbi:bifunctional [glutamate--ammonia ligase]-adenylyl-L-tyrosine phosphorylase/[glutamate--ammonia-ligase] adenylyltransferase [Nitrosovibrio sp. Nv6]|uniref:bifunctional [glutamate--ammonia ligase]-adenylyl-L-tyrosine phosphorylase/[glutamate--ammonia-ligase] adenylyltransferase n=1 Tax=Nitrosovibrio sp. Nv6 TaxID=1855340 RepID=UPI0008BECD42|nr:bifunctional [glutamate--ammonia ligase]-adenylyl-L-tyrosine phosphorylase/[glutamate--ammonia-ligase] adenylyltransferase [Nitrosovibrio sp. Nv6]SEP16004.1 glutamate-ammonia-ligase adenylyltransferase [Nitrosovibrio sp. Nv6]